MGTSGVFIGHTVTDLERFILWELGQLSGTTIGYSRFPKWLIRAKLTERQNLFVKLSQCLKRYALISLVDGYRTYPLPQNCMDNGVLGIRYYTDSSSYTDLDLYDEAWLDDNCSGWRVADEGTPLYAFKPQSYGNVQTVGLYPTPDTSGTPYSASLGTGIYYGTDLPQAGYNITGTTTSLGDSTTLNDSNIHFDEIGIVAGMYVRNMTDGSYARAATLADHTLTTTTLAGGTANIWGNGDTYKILSGEYMVECSQTYGERYLFGYNEGVLETITIPDDTLFISYVPYPVPYWYGASTADADHLNNDQYSEIPREHHIALAYGVMADLLSSFHENSKEFNRATYYEGLFMTHVQRAKADQATSPFQTKSRGFYPGKR
jgi:hypothetical protein